MDNEPKESSQSTVQPSEVTDVELLPVFDEEAGVMVKINAEKRQLASLLQSRMDMATIVTAVVIHRMQEEKLYLALGYSSFKEYCERRLPFGRQAAYKYIAVGRQFKEYLPESVASMRQLSGKEADQIKSISEVGVAKLYELTKVDDADFSEIANTGVVTLQDGTQLDLDQLKATSVKEVKETLDRYRDLTKSQEADIERAEQERDKALAEAEKIKKEAEEGLQYRKKFENKARDHKVMKQKVTAIREATFGLKAAISDLKELPIEFEDLVEELRDTHRLIMEGVEALRRENYECFPDLITAYDE